MVESHPSQEAATATNSLPDKYVPEKRRQKSGYDNYTPYFGLSTDGYEIVRHKHANEEFNVFLHRLLCVAEHGFEAVCGKIIHHKNGVKWDNRSDNLEIMTQKEHVRQHFRDESMDKKLTSEDVAKLRRDYTGDRSFKTIAEEYPVNKDSIRNAIRGDSWAWVDEEPVPVSSN